jgi:hypothetical protein
MEAFLPFMLQFVQFIQSLHFPVAGRFHLCFAFDQATHNKADNHFYEWLILINHIMKQIFTLALTLTVLATTLSAASPRIEINRKLLTSFSNSFSGASEISWSKSSSYLKASFKQNGQYLFAYYSVDGDLLGVSRNIQSTQLPLNLQSLLRKEYCGTWITELLEFSTKEQTIYMATVENADEKITIKSTSGHAWELVVKAVKP